MKCSNCHLDLKPNAVFCQNCGTRVKSDASEFSSQEIITVGRSQDNSISINSDGVSSYHARIYIKSGEVVVEDLNSTNGTFVNDQRVTKSNLNRNSVVYLGKNYRLDLLSIPKINSFFSNELNLNPGKDVKRTTIEPAENVQVMKIDPYQNNSAPIDNVQKTPSFQQQININVQQKPKSVGVSILLTFFFGPLGMLYSTISGGVIMLVISIVAFIFTFGFSTFITHPICIIWGAVAADNENKRSMVSTQTITRTN